MSAGERICLDDGSGVRARKNAAGANLRRPGRSPRVPAATPTRLWASRPRATHLGPGRGRRSQPRSAFQRISILHPRVFLRTFPDPPTRLNSQPPHDTPIVFPQITSHAPGLTLTQPQTPLSSPQAVQIAQNNPSLAILPNPQPSPRTTQKRPHTRFLRFAFPLPHPPYSTPK